MIGSFTLIKNEIAWIERHLKAWLPFLDHMVFFDGNSTDGTLEVLKAYKNKHENLTVIEDRDPRDLKEDYVRLFNECLITLDTDLAIFLHPDMLPISGEDKLRDLDCTAASTTMRVFAGEPAGEIMEESGRATAWKNIMRFKNPDLGLHYYGHYGAANEDMYFEDITGDEHVFHGPNFKRYPYPVYDSGCVIAHYSDVRPYKRRLERMISCLKNQGYSEKDAKRLAQIHPRVTLKSDNGIEFIKEKEITCLN